MIQADKQPIVLRKPLQAEKHPRSAFRFNKLLGRVAQIPGRTFPGLQLAHDYILDRNFAPRLSRPQKIPGRVRCDAIEPSCELRVALEERGSAPHLHENLSERFLSVLVIAQHSVEETVDRSLVSPQKQAQSFLILAFAQVQEVLVAHREIIGFGPLQVPDLCSHLHYYRRAPDVRVSRRGFTAKSAKRPLCTSGLSQKRFRVLSTLRISERPHTSPAGSRRACTATGCWRREV